MNVIIEMLPGEEDCKPKYMTNGSIGMDLKSTIDVTIDESVKKIPCGFKIQIPEGYEGQIRPRSGLAYKILMPNSPGTIDSDYRGEVSVLLVSQRYIYKIKRGQRIAQMIINKVELPTIEFGKVDDTERGE